MMMDSHRNTHQPPEPGFILTVVLIVISLCVMLVTYVAYNNAVFMPWASTMISREKASLLAESGVQLGLAQLGVPKTFEEEKKAESQLPASPVDQKKAPKSAAVKSNEDFLRELLPVINRWQEFTFTKKNDGFDGTLRICVVCENAKINLNIAYDFAKHDFASPDNRQLMEAVFDRVAAITKGANLFAACERFLKERQHKLDDVTELMLIKEFELFKDHVYYEPPAKESGKSGATIKTERPLYLTDMFTIEPERGCVQPWLLTDSVCGLYGFKRADESVSDEVVDKVLTDFKLTASWGADWDTSLAKLYGKKYADIPAIYKKLLATKFGLSHFSVVSYGTVGGVTQRVVAIVERKEIAASSGGPGYTLTVKKRYRL